MLRVTNLARATLSRFTTRAPLRRFASTTAFAQHSDFLTRLGLGEHNPGVFNGQWSSRPGASVSPCVDPSTGQTFAYVEQATVEDYQEAIGAMDDAKAWWAQQPAPVRGEAVRVIGEALREHREDLGRLVSLEMGKIAPEGVGEVQEAIDICDFAVGLSRSLNGQVLPSERPEHFMMERYNPLKGHVGIITAFNFPCAVFFWNAALSLVAGNTNLWKPAPSANLTAVACTKIVEKALASVGVPGAVSSLLCSGTEVGKTLVNDPRMELVSFTGSTKVGREVSRDVASRFGKSILELGGNNAMIVMDDAELELAVRASLFSAVGTAGQRCTSLRRVYVQEGVYDEFVQRLVSAYEGLIPDKIGGALEEHTLCGPLHNQAAVDAYSKRIEELRADSKAEILVGGNVLSDRPGFYVEPTIAAVDTDSPFVQEELFAPVLYVMKVGDLDEAIEQNNAVPQGLSSSLFTTNQQAIFKWTGAMGSDCGIVNVNIGPSGAEIGGAFGGEKETGGGRESGSDSWKQYMRRSTCTINHGDELPLAQGIKFE